MKYTYQKICELWGIDAEENRAIFEWLKDDPRDKEGRLTREVGIRKPGGKVEKLTRRRMDDGSGCIFYSLEDKALFPRNTGAMVSAMDFLF